MWISEKSLVTVQPILKNLLELIVSPKNLNNAYLQVQECVSEGYKYVVDLDLKRFFDTVNHSKQIDMLSRTIKDGRVLLFTNI